MDIETQSEDYHTAVCLHHAGIHANVTLSRDDKNREYFQIFTASSHYRSLGFSPEMWFWKGKGFDRDTANRTRIAARSGRWCSTDTVTWRRSMR